MTQNLQLRFPVAKLAAVCSGLCTGMFINFGAHAQSLQQLYLSAQDYDASYQSARQLADATIARGEQARAGILPSVNLGLSANQVNQTSSYSAYDARNFSNQTAAITATQPLYRPGNWSAYEQGNKQITLAQAQLLAAQQDLMVRVSQAYFDVLAATDSLEVVRSQKAAIVEQLSSAKRNFEVGTATIVDTRDAQARYDLSVAQELAAENDLRVKSLALDQLVGKSPTRPNPLQLPLKLAEIQPATLDPWVELSQSHNPQLTQLQIALDIAKLETEKAQAVNYPTLDLVGSYSAANNNGTSQAPLSYSVNQASIGVVLNYPIYAGRSITNHVKETLALEDKALSDLQAAQRNIAQATRSAYFGLQTARSQVSAYEAAEASSQSALDANVLGYQVGVKINIDVLNAQSQLYDTKAKLSRARYDVLLGELKLRQASGVLQASDIETVNAQLKP